MNFIKKIEQFYEDYIVMAASNKAKTLSRTVVLIASLYSYFAMQAVPRK